MLVLVMVFVLEDWLVEQLMNMRMTFSTISTYHYVGLGKALIKQPSNIYEIRPVVTFPVVRKGDIFCRISIMGMAVR